MDRAILATSEMSLNVMERLAKCLTGLGRRVRYIVPLLLFLAESLVHAQTRAVAVTFDDLPAAGASSLACDKEAVRDLTYRLLAHITEHQIPAIGFVNEGRPCPDIVEEVLSLWLDAGMDLGNHTATHPDLNDITVAAYQEDIINGEPITRRLLAERDRTLRYFRFPFLHAGDTSEKKEAIEAVLAERGYTIAPVTIDNDEWLFARAYARAYMRGDAAYMQRRIESAYVEWLEAVVAHFETWSVDVIGYEIPQVLLLHANQLNAAAFDDVASMLERRGYRFISLEEALEDPAYTQPDPYIGPYGISWLHRWARGKEMEVRWEPDVPDWINSYGN